MKGHGTQFGRKKEEAIAALLTQRNIEEAARATGVAPNTLLKWQKLPEFEAAYREARQAAFRQAVARLQQGTSAAATTLLKTMIDPNTSVPTVFGPSPWELSAAPTRAWRRRLHGPWGSVSGTCGRSCGCWRALLSYRYSEITPPHKADSQIPNGCPNASFRVADHLDGGVGAAIWNLGIGFVCGRY